MTDDELKRLLEANATEIRRHFDVATERLESRIGLVAEAVDRLDEKLGREAGRLEEEMDRGFTETQA
jgi:hypothetical protein